MKLTKATDYALILSAHLAALGPGESTNIRTVASECNIPKRFLANIVSRLSKASIVSSLKGVNGGIRLAKDSSEITMLEVVEAIEGSLALVNCQRPDCFCPLEESCTVKGFMDQMYHELIETFGRTTIQDLRVFADSGKLGVTESR